MRYIVLITAIAALSWVMTTNHANAFCNPSPGVVCLNNPTDNTCQPPGVTTMDGNRQNIIACLDDGTGTFRWKAMSSSGFCVLGTCFNCLCYHKHLATPQAGGHDIEGFKNCGSGWVSLGYSGGAWNGTGSVTIDESGIYLGYSGGAGNETRSATIDKSGVYLGYSGGARNETGSGSGYTSGIYPCN